MDSHRSQLGRGFNWLGGATVIAKIVDFGTILAMLLLLTKQQVGIASLVVSIGMVVEAFNGLGTSEALLQTRSVTPTQLDTMFWYVVGAALAVGSLTLLGAPLIQMVYGYSGLAIYFIAIAIKQPLVAAAVIPLAIMNRELQYQRIAVVNVCATLAAALVRLGLGAAGAGAWALVVGYAASGLFILIGAMLAHPFVPRLRFRMAEFAPLARFGWRAAIANMGEQIFKNVDYLLIGWFYGAAQLAIYRVAFDVAMEPAMAVGTLVNRTALPVFARVAAVGAHMAEALNWALNRIAVLVTPLAVAIMLAAKPLTSLIHDKQGNSYAAAAIPLEILAAAALLRVIALLLSSVMMGAGRPGTAARLAGINLFLLGGGILAIGVMFRAQTGIVAASAIWLGIYPLLMVWGARYLHRHWGISASELARNFAAPAIGALFMVGVVQFARHALGIADARIQVGIVLLATAFAYAGLFVYARRHRVGAASKVGALPRTPPGSGDPGPLDDGL